MSVRTLDEALDRETRSLLERYGFERSTFEALRARLIAGGAEERDNRLKTQLARPAPEDMTRLPPPGTAARKQLTERGLDEMRAGRVAVAVLAGGMATRFGGVVKATVPVLGAHTFLSLKLRDVARVAGRLGVRLRVCLMTSFATDAHVTALARAACSTELAVETFPQFVSLRLLPTGELFRDGNGELSLYAPGHGDFTFALRRAGLLASMRRDGVRYVFLSNVDNLAATLDPAIIALHVARGAELSFEVVSLAAGDKGGVPARLDGRLQVIEAMRYPLGFDERAIPWFSINDIVLSSDRVDRDFALDWFRVDKQVGGRCAVQFERLVNQLTAHLDAHAIWVDRDGPDGRFLPVKDPPDLTARLPMIESILEARGVL